MRCSERVPAVFDSRGSVSSNARGQVMGSRLVNIPSTCQVWERMMKSGDGEERKILANVRKDPCLPDETEHVFFTLLANSGAPADANEAAGQAYKVVKGDADRFVCQGNQVPGERFTKLFRIDSVDALRYRIPEALAKVGLGHKDVIMGDIPEEELRALTNEYKGEVKLGNDLHIVWVTDRDEAPPLLGDWKQLSDRLGRPSDGAEACCIFCGYNRDATEQTLHVPRTLDAIKIAEFVVNEDCSAESGRTRPITRPPEEGLPEAVHRSCEVVPYLWELKVL